MISNILAFLRLLLFKKKWRSKNCHNSTRAGCIFPIDLVEVKNGTYGKLNIKFYSKSNSNFIKIGNYCSIAENVNFLVGGEHPYKGLSTFPFKTMILHEGDEAQSKGSISVDDDVWIGFGCTILSGVHISRGAIIAAGSVVYKDVPPYAIYSNGKIIKFRFSDEIIEALLKVNYNEFDELFIKKNIDLLYSQIKTCDDINKILKELKKRHEVRE